MGFVCSVVLLLVMVVLVHGDGTGAALDGVSGDDSTASAPNGGDCADGDGPGAALDGVSGDDSPASAPNVGDCAGGDVTGAAGGGVATCMAW